MVQNDLRSEMDYRFKQIAAISIVVIVFLYAGGIMEFLGQWEEPSPQFASWHWSKALIVPTEVMLLLISFMVFIRLGSWLVLTENERWSGYRHSTSRNKTAVLLTIVAFTSFGISFILADILSRMQWGP